MREGVGPDDEVGDVRGEKTGNGKISQIRKRKKAKKVWPLSED